MKFPAKLKPNPKVPQHVRCAHDANLASLVLVFCFSNLLVVPTPPLSEEDESGFQLSASTSLSSPPPLMSPRETAPRAGGAIGAGSCNASPRRDPSSRRDVGFVSGVGSGGGRRGEEQQEEERECVICMEEFSKVRAYVCAVRAHWFVRTWACFVCVVDSGCRWLRW